VIYYQIITTRLTAFQEFTTFPGSIRWLYLPNEPHIESDISGHGTCVASKIASRALGVAKNANLVVVKAVRAETDQLYPSLFIAAWAIVARDIESAGLSRRAVLHWVVSNQSL
jgi:hypothetical protein